MPFSESSMLSPIVGYLEQRNPDSVLDVGVGFGQYGLLARNNLERFNLFEWDDSGSRKREREEWRVRIDGIEGFEPYISPVHRYVYNEIFIGDALEVLPRLEHRYQLVLAVEILEHFDKDDGWRFIDLLKRTSDDTVLVTTPKEFVPHQYPANPYENHRACWAKEELEAAGFTEFLDNPDSWIGCFRHSG